MADNENTGTQGTVDPTTPSQLDAAQPLNADGQKQDLTVGEPTPENAGTDAPGATASQAQATGTPDTAASNAQESDVDRTQDPNPDSPTEEQLQDPEVRAKLGARAEAERLDQANQSYEDYPEDKKQFEGQTVVTEHFAVTTAADFNGGYIEIGKRGNVGDTLRVSPEQLHELKDAIGKVKNLPKA